MRSVRTHSRAAVGLLFVLSAACSDKTEAPGEICSSAADCAGGECVDGRCSGELDGGDDGGDDGGTGDADAPPDGAGDGGVDGADTGEPIEGTACGDDCCLPADRCADGTCVPDLGACDTDASCPNDSYCHEDGRCTPYGFPPDVLFDLECERAADIGVFTPEVQCWWPPLDDEQLPLYRDVYSVPAVADLNLDRDPSVLAPSIAVATFTISANCSGGKLRVFDGASCEEQAVIHDAADRLTWGTSLAIADLDLSPDGAGQRTPEILGISRREPPPDGTPSEDCPLDNDRAGVIAFEYDTDAETWVRRWHGRECDVEGEPLHFASSWRIIDGVSVHDLDDDGQPEVLWDRFVYDSDGCLLNPGETYTAVLTGSFPVAADVDNDARPELIQPDGVFAWDDATGEWVLEDYWSPSEEVQAFDRNPGFAAVADFGRFDGVEGDSLDGAEIVALTYDPTDPDADGRFTGSVRVMTLAGHLVFGPIRLPFEPDDAIHDRGGPPTIGDVDGDGNPEIAIAGGLAFTVFDMDCDVDPESLPVAGCDRAGNGLPRGVLWSRPIQDFSSNRTGSSVFDFDGDGVVEVVYRDECYLRIFRGTDGEVLFSLAVSSGTGFEYPIIADVDGDYSTEIALAATNRSVEGCAPTDPIFPGEPVAAVDRSGLLVVRDAFDRWATSRPVWNQHAYAVTNVNDDGTIPRTSDWVANHTRADLNNFRMNVAGELRPLGAADLTVAVTNVDVLCGDESDDVTIAASVCNRGSNPVPGGIETVFYAGDPDDGADEIGSATVSSALDPGQCAPLSVTAARPEVTDIGVVVDPQGQVLECHDGNNTFLFPNGLADHCRARERIAVCQ